MTATVFFYADDDLVSRAIFTLHLRMWSTADFSSCAQSCAVLAKEGDGIAGGWAKEEWSQSKVR